MQTSDAGPTGKTTKQIFVTGGVVSSLGKGLTAASLGNLLTARGMHVVMQKLDPYLNVDPGTMNPFQHGEVFVTDDGAETDLDIGHYERFLGINLSAAANVTTGQIYSKVIERERRGEYLGDTVQVIPHITDEIKRRMRLQSQDDPQPDVIITEVGGTVGDIESQPFLEAARQLRHELGRDSVFFVHVSLVPVHGGIRGAEDQADPALRRCPASGRHPARRAGAAQRPSGHRGEHAQDRADVRRRGRRRRQHGRPAEHLRHPVDAAHPASRLHIVRRLDLTKATDVDWTRWQRVLAAVHNPKHEVTIGLVGKYIDLPDAYLSVTEAIKAGGFAHETKVSIRWIPSDECETPQGARERLADLDGICVPGGFGIRGIEGKLGALRFAREQGIPALGLCLGMQCMVIEYARNVAGLTGASSSEFDPETTTPVIATMAEQVEVLDGGDLGGTMRLGLYPARLAEGSLAAETYGATDVAERHRHRYEVNNTYRGQLAEAGLVFSGINPDLDLVEFVELPRETHPYYVATQAHPELRSRPTAPHPLFSGLVGAALERHRASELFEDED